MISAISGWMSHSPNSSMPNATHSLVADLSNESGAAWSDENRCVDVDVAMASIRAMQTFLAEGSRASGYHRPPRHLRSDPGGPTSLSDRGPLRRRRVPLGTARRADAGMTGYRVGYTVATQLVDELVEATDEMFLTTTMGRYGRIVLLVIVEPGYVALDCRGT